ncbi:MAG: hypothetical protein KH452_02475 [Clostridiales bacterium]|nr:hypothetical protein [Clostridiales bacterium]
MRRWKRYAAGAMAAATVCAGVRPVMAAGLQNPAEDMQEAAEAQDPAAESAEEGVFQMLPSVQPVQTYGSGDYQIQVFGGFTRMTDAGGISSALEDSRLLYKRGTMLLVSSEFDFYNGRPDQVVVDSVSGSSGTTTQYLSVLEQDRSIEDYYTDIQWPDELPNSNIVEISSTLDTSDTVLMVRYSDRTVAAFNYVTGKLLFRDESEKTELEFGEYVEGWITDTWNGLTDGVNGDYVQVEDAWKQADNENSAGFLPWGGQMTQNGTYTKGEVFLTEDGGSLETGTGASSGTDIVPGNGKAPGSDKETVLVIADGRLTEADGFRAETGEAAVQEDPKVGEAEGEAFPAEGLAADSGLPKGASGEDQPAEPDAGLQGTAASGADTGEEPGTGNPAEEADIGTETDGTSDMEGIAGEAGTADVPDPTAPDGSAFTEAASGEGTGGAHADAEAGESSEADSRTASAQAAPAALLTIYDPVTGTYQVCRTAEYLLAGGPKSQSREDRGGMVSQVNVETVSGPAAGTLQDQMGGLVVALAAVLGSGCLITALYIGNRKKTDNR